MEAFLFPLKIKSIEMMKVAFLYTLETNITLFKPYIDQYLGDKDVSVSHHVNEALLQRAMIDGLVQSTLDLVTQAIIEIDNTGVDFIICTCSTIGKMAESIANISANVIRVDRPMAEEAIHHADVLVLAALESTIEPTAELLKSCALQQRKSPKITTQVIPNVWSAYLAGDVESYSKSIAEHINQNSSSNDIIVLAQASMASALPLIHSDNKQILASPPLCLQKLAGKVNVARGGKAAL
jgi:hypothetical protein